MKFPIHPSLVSLLALAGFLSAESAMERLDKSWERSVNRIDEAWIKVLKRTWIPKDLEAPKKAYVQPKPVDLPKAETPSAGAQTESAPATLAQAVLETPPPPPPVKTPPADPDTIRSKFVFFGNNFEMPYAKDLPGLREPERSSQGLAEHWRKMSSLPHQETLEWFKIYYNNVLKSDWMLQQFIQTFCKSIYPQSKTLQTLARWFYFTKLGFLDRLAYNDSGVYLLLSTDAQLYGQTYFTFETNRYYSIKTEGESGRMGSVFTYPDNYPDAKRKIDYTLRDFPAIPGKAEDKILEFSYKKEIYKIPVKFQPQIADYVKDHPQMGIQNYGKAPLSKAAQDSLRKAVKPLLEGKTELEAINFLLALVQKSFQYKTDQDQFGYEKWFFAEELLYYPASDCEDRSVFFAHMVRLFLDNDVVFLNYPGHMATAVLFRQPPPGDRVQVRDKSYVVCDPTYINAGAGMAMPQFKQVVPKVAEIP